MRMAIVSMILGVAILGGCTEPQRADLAAQIHEIRPRIEAARDAAVSASEQVDAYAAQVEAMEPGRERDAAAAILGGLESLRDSAVARLGDVTTELYGMEEKLAAAEADRYTVAEQITGAVSRYGPEPWASLLGLGSAVVFGVLRGKEKRRREDAEDALAEIDAAAGTPRAAEQAASGRAKRAIQRAAIAS